MKVLVSHIGKAIEKLESGGNAECRLSVVMAKVGGMPFPKYCSLSCDVRPSTF
ncbi:MAG: hypothetical protein HOO98_09905 [Nitrospira sp.]|nr:hypothetical protein [Nitrospira sp.]